MVVNNDFGKPLCRQHYNQYINYGQFYKWNIISENEYIIHDDCCEIILYNRKMIYCGSSFVDKDDFKNIIKYKWSLQRGYAYNHKIKQMHNIIMKNKNKEYVVDHINRNRLDNRKNNLRLVSFTMNGFNKGKQSNNTSGYVGVSWDKSKNKWEAHIKQYGKKYFLGYFNNRKDAYIIRKNAEIEYYNTLRKEEFDINTVYKK